MRGGSAVSLGMRTLSTAALICLLAAPGVGGPRRADELVNTLQRRISVDFEQATLSDFVKYLRNATGINIVVMKGQIDKDGGDVDAVEITLKVNNVRVIDVLRLVVESSDLGLAVKGNLLLVTSKRAARGKPVLVMYSVADALIPIRDFPAPDMHIHPSGYEPPEPPEPEVHQAVESSEELSEMIRQFTGHDTWEDEGVAIHTFRHSLLIRQYPSVHREIARFLAAVRTLR